MKLVSFNDYRIGVFYEEKIYDISQVLPEHWWGTKQSMNAFISDYPNLKDKINAEMESTRPLDNHQIKYLAPIPVPGQIIAAPANYVAHRKEMDATAMTYTDPARRKSPRELGFFLKSPGSICGPSDAIDLPNLSGRRFDHEPELAVIIGKEAKGVKSDDAFDYVFGYTCLLDITLRMTEIQKEERSMRKSYATFTPTGPHIVTKDEIPNVSALDVNLWVNGELRQHANTSEMIVGIAEFIEIVSAVTVLNPGDIIAMGTPQGIGPIQPNDVVSMEIEQVGRLSLPVDNRKW